MTATPAMPELPDAAVLAAARELCKIHAGQCGVDYDDTWAIYSEQFKADARACLEAAAPALATLQSQPAAAGVSDATWEGAEEWMPLAWELCAEEHGEEACNELIWTGGPIPEPWGDRWLQYEDEAKRLIALVRKHVPALRPQADYTDADAWLKATARTIEAGCKPEQLNLLRIGFNAGAALRPQSYPLPDDLYDSKDWRQGNYASRVEWLHTMYEHAKHERDEYAAQLEVLRPQSESEQEQELRRSLAEAQATISERNAEIIELQKRIRRSPQAVPMTEEQMRVLRFLLGESALEDCYFGDMHPDKRGRFWWRNSLRDAFGITAPAGGETQA